MPSIRSAGQDVGLWTLESNSDEVSQSVEKAPLTVAYFDTKVSARRMSGSFPAPEQRWTITSDLNVRGRGIIRNPRTTFRPYFAFGSNLALAQMKRRCPFSPFVCIAVLKKWKWIIDEDRFANIIASEDDNDVVYGFLYDLRGDDEADLDAYESKYTKTAVHAQIGLDTGVDTGSWRMVEAMTYVDLENRQRGSPYPDYIDRMELAIWDALKMGVPLNYVRKYMGPFFGKEFLSKFDEHKYPSPVSVVSPLL